MNQVVTQPEAEALFESAAAALGAGKFDQALVELAGVVKSNPRHHRAFSLMAQIELHHGMFDNGAVYAEKAARLNPGDAMYHLLLGRLRKGQQKFGEAETSYRRAILVRSDFAEAYVSLGIVLRLQGRVGEAVECHRKALQLRPGFAEAQVNLANALREQGSARQANKLYRAAALGAPQLAAAQSGLAASLLLQGRKEYAIEHYRRTLAINPDQPALYYILGCLLQETDQEGAQQALEQAVLRQPDNASAWSNLGIELANAGRRHDGLACFERAAQLNPDHVEANLNLAMAVGLLGDTAKAERLMRHVAALSPHDRSVRAKLGLALMWARKYEEAIPLLREAVEAVDVEPKSGDLVHLAMAMYGPGRQHEGNALIRRAIAIDANDITAFSNLLLGLSYADNVPPAEIHAAARQLALQDSVRTPAVPTFLQPDLDPERKLRIGYLSPDLHNHSVSYFFMPVASRYDRGRFETFCYYSNFAEDQVSEAIRDKVDHWLNCYSTTDEQLAARIRDDRIDILVDLTGHTALNRLTVMVQKAAPVQMSWLGFPTAVGIPAIDYRVTDWKVDPDGYEAFNTEAPLRLPTSYFCYRPSAQAPEVGALPALAGRGVTFGSFNNLAKMSATALDLWAAVVRAVPGSRLLLKTSALVEAAGVKRITDELERRGLDAAQVELLGWENSVESHLSVYNRVDIALDSYPYNGATTTCEALWMGVPVVSLAGETHASRMGLSILSAAGFPQFIAGSHRQFVQTAAALAGDLAALSALRAAMRGRIAQSALMDEAGFTRGLEALYRDAWRRYCAKPSIQTQ